MLTCLFELIKYCINAKHSFSWQGGLLLNLHCKTGDEIINQDLQIINLLYSKTLEKLDLVMTSFYLLSESQKVPNPLVVVTDTKHKWSGTSVIHGTYFDILRCCTICIVDRVARREISHL